MYNQIINDYSIQNIFKNTIPPFTIASQFIYV